MAAWQNSHSLSLPVMRHVLRLIRAVMNLPGTRVDRETFLRRPASKSHCARKNKSKTAVETKPANAGVSRTKVMIKLANSIIKSHVRASSRRCHLWLGCQEDSLWARRDPCGRFAQFIWHAVVVAQKLAYLYGWPDLQLEDGDPDEETRDAYTDAHRINVRHSGEANRLLAEIASRFAT